ncbi:hypothetical protein H9Q74_014262 [Fusarium xylarioides]|nr:hypothetical protein H9Q74_014262 [Fusarium xylarioides]
MSDAAPGSPGEESDSSGLSDPPPSQGGASRPSTLAPSTRETNSPSPAPTPRKKGKSSKRLREARERLQEEAAAAAQDAEVVERFPPCLPCLNSAAQGRSDGICYDAGDGERRYERCVEGGSCKKIPKLALPIALYFLDFCRANPGPTKDLDKPLQKIKEKRRRAVKLVLDAIADHSFPDKHDIRLREAGYNNLD